LKILNFFFVYSGSEPFLLTNTASSVYNRQIFDRIVAVFKKSYDVLARFRNFDLTMYGDLVAPLPIRPHAARQPLPVSMFRHMAASYVPRTSVTTPVLRPLRRFLDGNPVRGGKWKGTDSAEKELL
jgi:hypothetical protein